MLKSTDGGDTWAKTIIWDHPYPMWNPNFLFPTDSFYCADGAHSLDFDQSGLVHVVFGINRAYCDGAGTFWFPAVGGIAYWNENMPSFSDNVNALNPYGHPDSELEEDYNLIGWSPDINGNGQLELLDSWGRYYLGFSSMPQICVDDVNGLFVVFSSVTETYDNGVQNYRHLWARYSPSPDNWTPLFHVTNQSYQAMHENINPSLSVFSQDFLTFHLTYQYDGEPGLAVKGDNDPYTDNMISYLQLSTITGTDDNHRRADLFTVSQNYPNPFDGSAMITVDLKEPAKVVLTLTGLTGNMVQELNQGRLPAGVHRLSVDAGNLHPGIYFYTIQAGDRAITRKMVVK